MKQGRLPHPKWSGLYQDHEANEEEGARFEDEDVDEEEWSKVGSRIFFFFFFFFFNKNLSIHFFAQSFRFQPG